MQRNFLKDKFVITSVSSGFNQPLMNHEKVVLHLVVGPLKNCFACFYPKVMDAFYVNMYNIHSALSEL